MNLSIFIEALSSYTEKIFNVVVFYTDTHTIKIYVCKSDYIR